MKYIVDKPLTSFEFWSGAADRAKALTYSELEQLDDMLPELLGEEASDTDINDTFWFDFPVVCHLLGYACVDDDPIREPADFKKDFRLDILKTYMDEQEWKYTEEQAEALDAKLLEDGTYEIDAENDTLADLYDSTLTESDAQAVGIQTEDS